mgnify:CR=1 FL=1
MLKIKYFFIQYYKTLIVSLFIFLASMIPGNEVNKVNWLSIPNIDKIIHLVMYFLLAMIMVYDVSHAKENLSSKRIFLISTLLPIFYGALLEILQLTLTNSRSGDFFDFVFNSIGVILAIILWSSLRNLKS